MIKRISSEVLIIFLFLLLSGCDRSNNLELTELRFIVLFVLLLAVAISVASSYKNGGNK